MRSLHYTAVARLKMGYPGGWEGAQVSKVFWLVLMLAAPNGLLGEQPTGDLVRWRSILDGEAESRETHRPVLYFFTADWCPPCEALKRTVFSDPAVADLIEQSYVPVAVDDVGELNQAGSEAVDALKLRFLVSRIPSLVVSHPDGGPAVSEVGAPVYSKMVGFLQTAVDRLAVLERVYAAESPRKKVGF